MNVGFYTPVRYGAQQGTPKIAEELKDLAGRLSTPQISGSAEAAARLAKTAQELKNTVKRLSQ